jgi:malonate-semialdehyde dehydrogenase (acetylating)/methylmalonate-semialdehyde dehydrogenase
MRQARRIISLKSKKRLDTAVSDGNKRDVTMGGSLHHFIGGAKIEGTSGRTGLVFNPATGEVSAEAPYANIAEVNSAVASATAALPGWAQTPASARSQVMFRFRELVIANMDVLAEIVSREHGKTLADAKGSIQRGIDVIEFACGIPHLMKGEYSANIGGGIDTYSMREPVGVVAGITPFNFPVMIPLWMGVMAVACGNCFINKPSEKVPSAPLFLAELWIKAGLPDGVWNVVIGDKEAVGSLLEHADVAAVSFVGSTPVGEYVYRQASAAGKRVQAFCGAKNHMVILPDADMDQAADALMGSGYGSSGQRCMAISVVVPVGEAAAQAIVNRLTPRVQALKIGPFTDPDAELGPLITKDAKARVERYIGEGVSEGAELLVDGRGSSLQGYEGGFFVGGTLFDRVRADMSIYADEIFGPVLGVVRAETYGDAVDLVNSNEFGNGVAIFTRDGDAARNFCNDADIGMIGVNVPIPVPMAFHHFGGSKRSKFGDSQMHGPQAVQFFTKLKTISARWPSGAGGGTQFSMPTNR